MKERYCKFLDASMEGCFCERVPKGNVSQNNHCYCETKGECKYFEPKYDEEDKDLIKELLKFIQKEVSKIGKMTTTDSLGERPLLFFEAFGELKKRIEEKYGIGQ